MPTFNDPVTDAEEASQALRGLAHATRTFDNPADTYAVIGDLLGGVRSLRQVLDQLAGAHTANRVRAHDDAGDQTAGATFALSAANDLQHAASLLDGVHDRLDVAMSASGRIAWHDVPAAPESVRRWISVVFLQGDDADQVLNLIDRDGTDAAIEHLAGFDYGEETVQAALVNGYVYDTPPTGALDKTATRDVYTLTYSPFLGHVSLLREYDAFPDPVLLGIDTPTPAPHRETEPHRESEAARATTARAASQRRAPQEVLDDEDEWSASRSSSPSRGRSL